MKRFVSVSTVCPVTEFMNVLTAEENVLGKKRKTAWTFRCELSSDHAVPTAAVYSD